MRASKIRSIGYWASTGVIAFVFGPGAIPDLIQSPGAVDFVGHLGYPPYFLSLIGVWKILGAVTLLVPKFPRLKEWAYAGIIFDLTGASISHAVKANGALNIVLPLVLACVAMASWALRPESRRLGPLGLEAA